MSPPRTSRTRRRGLTSVTQPARWKSRTQEEENRSWVPLGGGRASCQSGRGAVCRSTGKRGTTAPREIAPAPDQRWNGQLSDGNLVDDQHGGRAHRVSADEGGCPAACPGVRHCVWCCVVAGCVACARCCGQPRAGTPPRERAARQRRPQAQGAGSSHAHGAAGLRWHACHTHAGMTDGRHALCEGRLRSRFVFPAPENCTAVRPPLLPFVPPV